MQLLSDFIAAIYVFGLLGTSLSPEVATALVFFAPLLLLFWRKDLPDKALVGLGILALMAGALEVLFDTRGRMLVFGLGLGAFLAFWPDSWHRQSRQQVDETTSLGAGLTLGLALSVLFRVWNFGVDPGGQEWYQVIGGLLAITAAGLLLAKFNRPSHKASLLESAPAASFFKITGLYLGLMSALGLLYFAFASPSPTTRR